MARPLELAAWACWPQCSRGRRHAEPTASGTSAHEIDRDRVVHSTAFRRLMYKTQVFVNHEGDLFRTRLTHSLEVAQLSRSMARRLRLNEDLMETIALAHDLGHPPFGHAGQDVLARRMAPHGGFEHNLQSLRVVDALEQPFVHFDGLNLSFETREGILKRCSRLHAEELEREDPQGVGRRFVDATRPSLEAQLVNLADELTYTLHDIDDGLRSGLLTLELLDAVPLFGRQRRAAVADDPGLEASSARKQLFATLRRMAAGLLDDLIEHTARRVQEAAPRDVDDLRRMPELAGWSDDMRREVKDLARFLFRELYRHPQVVQTTAAARRVVDELFDQYASAPAEMTAEYREQADRQRAVCDYIAGMTDRFALREHQRLTGRQAFAACS